MASRMGAGEGPRRPERRRARTLRRALLFYTPIVLFLLVTVAPIYWIVLSAFTPINDLFTIPLSYIPRHPSLVNFQRVAQIVPLARQSLNSTLLAGISSAVSVLVSMLAAYAFARIRFPGRGVLLMALLLSGLLPSIATVIPLFQLFQNLGLIDSLLGMLILLVNLLLPASVWLLTTFIRQIPVELEEAARVDGAAFPAIFALIVIPVLRPALATLFLINFITAWDEFFIPLIFSRSGGTSTLTLGITQAAVDPQFQSVIWGNEAAMGLIVTVPVFVLAMAFQKQIVEGLMAGALKG